MKSPLSKFENFLSFENEGRWSMPRRYDVEGRGIGP